jgi:hypothetical protein
MTVIIGRRELLTALGGAAAWCSRRARSRCDAGERQGATITVNLMASTIVALHRHGLGSI